MNSEEIEKQREREKKKLRESQMNLRFVRERDSYRANSKGRTATTNGGWQLFPATEEN